MNKYFVYTLMILLIPFGQNCSQPFNVQEGGLTELQSIASAPTGVTPTTPTTMPTTSTTMPSTPTTVSPTTTTTTTMPVANNGEKVLVTVGVGVGGRRISGINGFQTIISDQQAFSAELQALIKPDPADATKLICPTGTSQMGNACCFRQYECIGGGWHSDWLFRAIAFGNGMFVAAGGQSFGIIQTSTDGVTWSQKYNLNVESGLVTGARTSMGWIAGIAFGKGRFVAADGGGKLMWSTDGKNWKSTSTQYKATIRALYFIGDKFYASGDGGVWGISNDGSVWDSTGSVNGMVDVVKVGEYYYGTSGTSLYRSDLKDPNVWQEVYMNTAAPSFIYNTIDQTFNLISGNRIATTKDPLGTWTAVGQKGPGRWLHHNGVFFTGVSGKNGQTSTNGITWVNTPSQMEYNQPILQITSGLVPKK